METKVWLSSFSGPWGPIWLASTSVGLCGISLREGRRGLEEDLRSRGRECAFREDSQAHAGVIRQLEEYFRGARRTFHVDPDLWGTPFQIQVWKLLVEIPYGETWSYKDLAQRADRPRGFRAVGQANGRNPVPVIVPCHRVIQSDGGLGGFGSGLDIKRDLLALEARGA